MSITIENVLTRLPEIQKQMHPNITFYVMLLAASDERRALLNRNIDLGGTRYAHAQENSNRSVILNTFVYPYNFDSRIFKARHGLMIILDGQIDTQFRADLAQDDDMQYSVNCSLLGVAYQLGVSPSQLLFTLTV